MGLTHISIYQGKAQMVEAAATAPTDREIAEYKLGKAVGLSDGDWYYDTAYQALGILVGSTWYYIEFTSTP